MNRPNKIIATIAQIMGALFLIIGVVALPIQVAQALSDHDDGRMAPWECAILFVCGLGSWWWGSVHQGHAPALGRSLATTAKAIARRVTTAAMSGVASTLEQAGIVIADEPTSPARTRSQYMDTQDPRSAPRTNSRDTGTSCSSDALQLRTSRRRYVRLVFAILCAEFALLMTLSNVEIWSGNTWSDLKRAYSDAAAIDGARFVGRIVLLTGLTVSLTPLVLLLATPASTVVRYRVTFALMAATPLATALALPATAIVCSTTGFGEDFDSAEPLVLSLCEPQALVASLLAMLMLAVIPCLVAIMIGVFVTRGITSAPLRLPRSESQPSEIGAESAALTSPAFGGDISLVVPTLLTIAAGSLLGVLGMRLSVGDWVSLIPFLAGW